MYVHIYLVNSPREYLNYNSTTLIKLRAQKSTNLKGKKRCSLLKNIKGTLEGYGNLLLLPALLKWVVSHQDSFTHKFLTLSRVFVFSRKFILSFASQLNRCQIHKKIIRNITKLNFSLIRVLKKKCTENI